MKIIKTICITMLCLLALTSNAKLQVPELTSRVVDNANILTASQHDAVEFAIKQLEDDTGGQLAVLIILSLEGENLEEFSMRVAEQWQIGYKGKDNGVILLISSADRKIRLEVGSGWDELINNTRSQAIINKMGSYFRDGKFADGVINAVNSVNNLVSGKKNLTKPKKVKPLRASASGWNTFIEILFILVIFLVIFLCFKNGGVSNGFRYGNNSGGRTYGSKHYNSSFFGSSGFSGGSSGGGGGFSGGGGGFSGGGASGGW
jgi:uncharacterized protein